MSIIDATEPWNRFRQLWFHALARLGYRRLYCLQCDLLAADAGTSCQYASRVRILEAGDAADFVRFRNGPGREVFLRRLRQGHHCFAAIADETIASVTWVATRTATLWRLNGDFDLADGDVYLYDSYTHPTYRGRRLQADVFDAVRGHAVRDGIRRAITFVAPENRSNLRSRRRTGFRVCGMVRRFRIGPVSVFSSRGTCPAFREHAG